MEMYGVQQQLGRLQMGLETTQENYNIISRIRLQAEEEKRKYQDALKTRSGKVQANRDETDKLQSELDHLAATLKQIGKGTQDHPPSSGSVAM